jgi:two-component system chemotaxis response regulator CheB
LVCKTNIISNIEGIVAKTSCFRRSISVDTRQYNSENSTIGFQSPNRIVVIGAGVGGPQALESILGELPIDFPGTVLVDANMGKGFTRVLANKLSATSRMPVSEALDGQILRSSRIILLPSEYTASVTTDREDPNNYIIELKRPDSSPKAPKRLDHLMSSVATAFGKCVIGIVLSGVGNDGLIGTNFIKAAGGKVFAQNEASSICYGAPGAVVTAGLLDQVAPLWQLASYICANNTGDSYEDAA